MPTAAIVLFLVLCCFILWGIVKLSIWIMKTAIKEALREYEAEKESGHGPQ